MLVVPLLAWALGPAPLAVQALTDGNSSIYHQKADLDTYNILQRNAAIQSQLSQTSVQGIKKMSDDEGEKFFLDYWYFGETNQTDLQSSQPSEKRQSSLHPRIYPYQPSHPLDLGEFYDSHRWMGQFSPLLRREFKCPAGTNSCTSINRPNSCCSTGSTCELVDDTGSGDVGCCPDGENCSGTIGSCQQGYTSCPASLGGGCCIPGYECVSGGCANVYTVTITVSSTVMVSTVTDTVPATSTVSSSSSSSSSSTTKSSSESTGEFTPPARPTSLSTATASQTGSICPIGFYACSAVYQGGCCRTGRDCDTSSCPQTPSTTITTNDRTIVVPAETEAPPATTGRCASGWFRCADTAGGGCCPTGFACGSSCTAQETATATGTVAKEQPTNSAGDKNLPEGMKMVGISLLLGLLWTI
ncbi:unnamed protein product [Aspergillus oryzae RIB40]|uniref:DNA, SC012 n=1 Tax=Aspergillus oryzae (strain ATCC 42149 / RIB 40) TaxID=510516 RepID=Q2UBT1_ASPOR|nr:unnamed protein product [Aspergillus oryzae RIB40]BAE60984.1 unnamed protein product [Aspergillus oryzae RIB40]